MRVTGRILTQCIIIAIVFFNQIMAYNDGSTNAPAGVAPQHPTLLNGYAKRPPWKVAGVDYGVGIPAGTVLKSPKSIRITGVDIDSTAHRVWINTSNVTLDGYDFTTGWDLVIGARGTANNTVIKNSKFNNDVTAGWHNVTNLYVGYCEIDGMNQNGGFQIFLNGGSGLTAEYNWFKNSSSDFISVSDAGAIMIRYNLMEQNGTPGTHPDWLQQLGTAFTTTSVLYNTAYKSTTGQGTQGFMVEGTQTGEIGFNVMIAKGAGASYVTGMNMTVTTNTGLVHDNYVDLTNAYGFFYGNPPSYVTLCGNYNMVTGQFLSGQSACSPSGTIKIARQSISIQAAVLVNSISGKVTFQLPNQPVSGITILDAQGRVIRDLDGLTWDGKNVMGNQVQGGVYFYRITAGSVTQNGKFFIQN
jgi:hypothetical protein